MKNRQATKNWLAQKKIIANERVDKLTVINIVDGSNVFMRN